MADRDRLGDALALAARVGAVPAERVFLDRTGQLRVEAGPEVLTADQARELDLLAGAVARVPAEGQDREDRSFPAYAARLAGGLAPALGSLREAAGRLGAGSAGEDGPTVRYVDRVEAGVTRLSGLVLGLEQYAAAGRAPCPVPLDPRAVLDAVRPELAALEGAAGARLSLRAEPVRADETGFRLLLRHLLDNALRYHRRPPATVTVRVRAGAGGSWALRVADDGPGVPAGDRTRMLSPLERLDRDSGLPGLGLGLTTGLRIAAAHGGRLWLEGRPGGGTVAVVEARGVG